MRNFKKVSKLYCLFLFCMFVPVLQAQNVRISGTVYDKTNDETVVGASVIVKGSTIGTITDLDGKFFIENVPANSVLQVSYVGYKSQEIPVEGKTLFNIMLEEDSQVLDELVVVGYGVMRKSDLTGAVGSVKGADALRSTPTADLANALQGRLAGVRITSATGDPSQAATIRIRGVNSMEGDAGPLLVIDGVPGGATLASLNPSDIASIEVLKDASASATYGFKGANGVILVTTKNPEAGKVKLEYNAYVNFKSPIRLPDMMSPVEFAELANDFGREYYPTISGQSEKVFYTDEQIAGFRRGEGTYDYLDNVFRDVSIEHTHEVSISGGSENTRYLFSGMFNDNQGIAYNSNSKRANYRLKVDSDIRKWLKVGFNFWGDYTKSYGPRFSQYNGLLVQTLTFPNTILPRDPENDNHYNNENLLGPQYNPMLFVNEFDKDRGYANNNRLQGYFEIEFLKGLTFRMTQGFNFGNRIAKNTQGKYSYDYYQNNSRKTAAEVTNTDNLNWININTLSYIKEFNKNHRINATFVFEQEQTETFKSYSKGLDLLSTIIGSGNTNASQTTSTYTNKERATTMATLARVNYVLMNRYMFTASLRYDGSSRMKYPENTWDYFPSMAVAWNMKEEKFMQNIDFLDQFKVRFGYGETGNQYTGQILYLQYDNIASNNDADKNPAYTLNPGNANLKWERTKQLNGGLDMGFFNNRLTVNLDIYKKTSDHVITKINIPLFNGVETNTGNGATIQNKGFELTIGGDPFTRKNFHWNTSLTLGHNKGIVKDLPDGQEFMTVAGNYENNYFRYIKGEKLATMWGYVSEGVWTTEEVAAGLAPTGVVAGSYKYADLDGEDGIGEDDKQIIGNGQPSFEWGWTNTLRYKDFDFGIFLIGIHGFDIYNYTREARFGLGATPSLGPNPEWKDRWIAGKNENTDIAGFISQRNALTPSSQYVEKGGFVKVKSITIGYTLPKHILSKIEVTNLRVYASIQNPFLFTNYSGIDPESTLKSPITSGIDWGYYPNGRDIMIGLNLTF